MSTGLEPPPAAPKAKSGLVASLLYLLSVLIMTAIMSTIIQTGSARTLSHTEFKQKVRANEVQSVVITASRIQGDEIRRLLADEAPPALRVLSA